MKMMMTVIQNDGDDGDVDDDMMVSGEGMKEGGR